MVMKSKKKKKKRREKKKVILKYNYLYKYNSPPSDKTHPTCQAIFQMLI